MTPRHARTCRNALFAIVRYQLPYAENMSDDLKELLTVADWTYKETFVSAELPRGLSFKAANNSIDPRLYICGNELLNTFRDAVTWKGGTWNVNLTYFPGGTPTDCADCVEIDIGNDPDEP